MARTKASVAETTKVEETKESGLVMYRLSDVYADESEASLKLKDLIGKEIVVRTFFFKHGRKNEMAIVETNYGVLKVKSKGVLRKLHFMEDRGYHPFVATVVKKAQGADLK